MNQGRRRLAALRLCLLYAIACWLMFESALALRDWQEALPSSTPPSPRLLDRSLAPAQFAGVTVELERYSSPLERRAALERLQLAGFGWVRQRFDWSQLEPEPGRFRWERSDPLLQDIRAVGLEPVIVLDGSPAWARAPQDRSPTDNPLAPPEDPDDFARFAGAFARRYGGQVRFYQVWDEPNIAPHWGARLIDPVAYARLLRVTASALRQADSDAVILLAALAPTQDRGHTAIDEPYFLQRVYAAGAAPAFDGVAVQPFGFGTEPDDPRSRRTVLNFQRTRLIRRTMLAAGDGDTPVWIIRYGWNRRPNRLWRTVTPKNQAIFAEEALRLARNRWPWVVAMGWAIDAPTAPPDDPLWGFGLVTPEEETTLLLERFRTLLRNDIAWRAAQAEEGRSPREQGEWITSPLLGLTSPSPIRLLSLLAALTLVLWRARAALQILNVEPWLIRWRNWPVSWRFVVWSGLIGVYFFATWPPLIGLCLLVAATLCTGRPRDGVLLAVALIPFHYQHKEILLGPFVWTLAPAQAVLLALLPAGGRWLLGRWSDASPLTGVQRRLRPMDWLALAWLIISLLSAAHVWHWPGYLAGLWSTVLVPLVMYAGVRATAAHAPTTRLLASALFLGGVVSALIGLLDWVGGGGVWADGMRRLLGVTFSPNQTALYLVRTAFVGVGLFLTARTPLERASWLSSLAVVALALLMTGSRGALFLGVPAGVVVIWLYGWKPGKKMRMAVLAVALLFAGGGALLLGERLLNSATVSQRYYVWKGAAALWAQFPLIGVGPGGFFWRYPAFMLPEAAKEPNLLHPHNLWLEYATGWGTMGLSWLLWLLKDLVRQIRQRPNILMLALLAGLIAGLAHAQVDAFTALPELAAWNWVVLALLATGSRKRQQ